jgi:spore coat-associated protein N
VVIGSGAAFNSSSANPGNTFSAGNLSQSNSKAGAAILTAASMSPGESTTGTVDITNNGDVPGAFSLSSSNLTNTPASPAFSSKLDLTVEDCGTPAASCASPSSVYSGKLGALGTQALGTFAAGAAHRYRFTVTFPDGGVPSGPSAGDNAYKGAQTSIQFDWQSAGA